MASANNALRLLEIIFLLMPVVAIMLQTVINFYSNENIQSTQGKKYLSIFGIVIALILFLFSAVQLLFLMSQSGVSSSLIVASSGSLAGLFFALLAVVVMAIDVPLQTSDTSLSDHQENYTVLTESELNNLIQEGIDTTYEQDTPSMQSEEEREE